MWNLEIAGDGVSLAPAGKLRLKQSLQTRSPSNCSDAHEACLTKHPHPQSIMHSSSRRERIERQASGLAELTSSVSVF